jgi:prepilin-type N-terminal cleavage/methylation domain-containing protein
MNCRLSNNARGYTLVETLVSLAIIGILAAGIVTTFLGKTEAQAAYPPMEPVQIVGLNSSTNLTPNSPNSPITDNITSLSDNPDIIVDSDQASRRMELRIVQTAMDIMIVTQQLQNVKTSTGTSDMTTFPEGHPLYPKYLRDANTQFRYTCDSEGNVDQLPD